MPRVIKKKRADKLFNSDKATYEDGTKPQVVVPCSDHFSDMKASLANLSSKIDEGNNDDIMGACANIIDCIGGYHISMVEEMAKLGGKPSVDASKIDSIDTKLNTLLMADANKAPKKWDFEIKKDMFGKFENIVATEIKH